MADLKNWLNSDPVEEGASTTVADYLRAFIENLYKAIVELLNALGEWPIDLK